jgi:tRNA(Arg) A34 adenosine deaminase TadA
MLHNQAELYRSHWWKLANIRVRVSQDIYLRAALEQARKSLSEGGIPIGAVLVHGGRIIGRGHNCRVAKGPV